MKRISNRLSQSTLTKAFNALIEKGYFAEQNFWCCQSCGTAAIPDEFENKYVFYHNQDNDDRLEGNDFYLAWSGDGREICSILKEHGIDTQWDGSDSTRIKVINKHHK